MMYESQKIMSPLHLSTIADRYREPLTSVKLNAYPHMGVGSIHYSAVFIPEWNVNGWSIPCTTYNLAHPHVAYLNLQGRQNRGQGGRLHAIMHAVPPD